MAASSVCSSSGDTSKVSPSSWATTVTTDPSAKGSPSKAIFPSTIFPVATFMSAPSVSGAVEYGDIDPAMIEGESARFADRILDADDARALVTHVLNHVEPISLAVLTRTVELRVGKPHRPVV